MRDRRRTRRQPPRVVVGVGESPSSRADAGLMSVARGWVLDVVTAWPDLGETLVHEVPGHYCQPRGRAVAALQGALAACGVEIDGPIVRVHVENKDPVQALLDHSLGAAFLVVGSSNRGRSRRAGCAAISEWCRTEASCPVVVISSADALPRKSA